MEEGRIDNSAEIYLVSKLYLHNMMDEFGYREGKISTFPPIIKHSFAFHLHSHSN